MNETKLTMGSLFDGIGGFPYCGAMYNIESVWASEIESSCIRITKKHFPNMKHLGSITDINGAEIEPVDIITFGSPCTDLSLAGRQKGLLVCANCDISINPKDNFEHCPDWR